MYRIEEICVHRFASTRPSLHVARWPVLADAFGANRGHWRQQRVRWPGCGDPSGSEWTWVAGQVESGLIRLTHVGSGHGL